MAVARYGAIGTDWLQFHVVFPFAVDVETRRPLASAVSPSGTVTEMSKSALSFGLSLAGYQPGDPCGSLTTYAPSSVGTKPSIESSGSVIGTTTPEYSTTTENCVPSRGFSRGKTVSSWPECDHSAASILKPCFVPVLMLVTVRKSRRSRLKLLRPCVASATIVAVPTSRSVAGS